MNLTNRRVARLLVLAFCSMAGSLCAQAKQATSDSSFRAFLPTYEAAVLANINGDVAPLRAIESHAPDVSIFSPFGPVFHGYERVSAQYELVAARMQPDTANALHVEYVAIDATDDMAYVVAIERSIWTPKGGTPRPGITRVTTIFRWEDGAWKLVHRHMDHVSEQG